MINKPLLVFIPGTLCTSQVFQPIVENLKYDAVLIDYKYHDSLQAMSEEVLRLVGDKPFMLGIIFFQKYNKKSNMFNVFRY